MLSQLKTILETEIDPAFAKRAEFIFEQAEKSKPEKILDAGCGRGFYLKSLSFYKYPKEIHGIDIEEKYLKIARSICDDKRIIIKNASIYSLSYPNNYFDFIICSEVLEHLKDDSQALIELNRVLKKGGVLILTVPNFNFPFLWDPLNWILMKLFNTHINKNIWWLAGIWADHERLYTHDQLQNLLRRTGFVVKNRVSFIRWCIPFSHFLLYGIGKNIVERLGAKQFDRFNFNDKKISRFLANIFRLPQKLESKKPSKISVSIVFKATKK